MNLGTWERVLIIGRAEDCQIRLDNDYVSPHHCAVMQDAQGRTFVADLGSTNGTSVQFGEGPRIKVVGPTPIRPGCTIWVSRVPVPWTA